MSGRSEQLDQLATALSGAQAEFTAIPKDASNPFFKSKYASLPKVVEVASPILTKHGLSVSQFIGTDGNGGDTLTTWLLHKSGQYIADEMRLHLAKNDPQGQGSSVSYARRYSYMSVLGLVADEDDDGNAATRSAQKAPKQAPKPLTEPPTPEDVAALKRAAKGLTAEKVKLALTSCAISIPEPFSGKTAFAGVPRAKVQLLAEALGKAPR